MKPNFALSLSFEGISLLHRAFPGWNRVGEVGLDSPDLAGALAVLRETAEQIDGQDITSKLVIPNDQIKYLSLDLGIMAEDERDAAIRTALEGATPYPVDDLQFDWSVEGDKTQVAAVARETLAEAEAFAESHGFGPLSFVAIPPEGQFSGEPFFGATAHAATLLGEGEQVQRDMAAIRVTGVVRLPDPGDEEAIGEAPDAAADTAEDAADVSDAGDAEDAAAAEPVPPEQPASDTVPEPDTGPAHTLEPEPEAATEAEPDAATETEIDTESSSDTEPEEDAGIELEAAPEDEPTEAPEDDDEDASESTPEPAPLPVFGHTALTDEDDGATDSAPEVGDDTAEPEGAEEPEPTGLVLADSLPTDDTPDAGAAAEDHATGDMPGAEAAAPEPAFASMRARRDGDEDEAGAAPALSGVRRDAEGAEAPAVTAPVSGTPGEATAAPAFEDGEPLDDVPPMPAYLREADPEPALPAFPDSASEPLEGEEDTPQRGPAFLGRKGAETASGLAAALAARRSLHDGDALESERQRMTVFGARKPEKPRAEIGGKPRHLGLILSVVLLLFLAGVAAWASLFMEDGFARVFGGPPDTEVAVLPADAVDELDAEGEEAMVPAPPEPDDAPMETASLTVESQPEEDTPPPALVEPALPHALTEKEAQARYAVTGVWQRAPQAPQLPDQLSLDDLYVTSIDPGVDAQDAVALPGIAALETDFTMARVPLPAARGSRFQLDDRGLVVARAEGALSPEGFLVFAGRPQVWPAALPQRLGQDAPATTDEELARRAGVRPKARPGGLIEQNERQNLGGLTRAELAKKRPKTRPEQPADKVEEEQDETGTEFAVAESRKPRPRPSNFTALVERAQTTQQTTEPQETTQVAAAVPRAQVAAPSAPSKASVAQAATVRNQINLRKVNLIGVYGKPSSRRALVRLANGRYKKVQVGDRLDGGRVQAIGDDELRYTKNGRNVTLKMPRG